MRNIGTIAFAIMAALAISGGADARGSHGAGGGHGGGHSHSSGGHYSSSHVSGSSHYVHSYTRRNGTHVAGYHATNPNHTRNDNYSTRGNVNPYTGKAGTKPRDGEH